MKRYEEEEFLLLSGIQHFEFCRRQWALIHIEQQWAENLRTVEGNIFHKTAHDGELSEKRGDLIISRQMAVHSNLMGISGVCDVVEFHSDSKNGVEIFGREGRYQAYPVEYKKGVPKETDVDILQMVAQAMCLEEMLFCKIPVGYLYYGETRHRIEVLVDAELREKVKTVVEEMHQYYNRRYTPKVKTGKKCNACSLKDLCMPKLCKDKSVREYILKKINEDGGI